MTEQAEPWDAALPVNGVRIIELLSWRQFVQFVTDVLLERRHYVWRGQSSDEWLLDPTLDRVLKVKGLENSEESRTLHLENFKYAVRGRRGPNPVPITTENEWWALGQHHGLATPLLDWTHSPFVAAYFAFSAKNYSTNGRRAIFALSTTGVKRINRNVQKLHEDLKTPPLVEFVNPLSDDNARLVNQGGLFTRAPNGIDMESWVRKYSSEEEKAILAKLSIPDGERERILRELNRMNINHLSLFPDLYGASKYCNYDLEIKNY